MSDLCDYCAAGRPDDAAELFADAKRYKQALEKIVKRFTDAKSEGLNSIATISYELCMIANKALKESGQMNDPNAPKAIILEIISCSDCPWRHNGNPNFKCTIKYPHREIPVTTNAFPHWCPLPDAEESNDAS